MIFFFYREETFFCMPYYVTRKEDGESREKETMLLVYFLLLGCSWSLLFIVKEPEIFHLVLICGFLYTLNSLLRLKRCIFHTVLVILAFAPLCDIWLLQYVLGKVFYLKKRQQDFRQESGNRFDLGTCWIECTTAYI